MLRKKKKRKTKPATQKLTVGVSLISSKLAEAALGMSTGKVYPTRINSATHYLTITYLNRPFKSRNTNSLIHNRTGGKKYD